MIQEVPAFCGKDCGGDACPLLAIVEDGKVSGLKANPAAGGFIKACPRGYQLHQAGQAADRLTRPLIAKGPRGSGRFREASWDEALGLVAARLGELRLRHGGSAVLSVGGAGSTGCLHGTSALLSRFMNASRSLQPDPGPACFLGGSYSNGAAVHVLPYLFGDQAGSSGWDAATVQYSELIVLWGANLLEARLGSELGSRVSEAARQGVPVVAVDPRYSRSARTLNARWLAIRPGTDAALLLAVIQVLLAENRVDLDRARSLASGIDELADYVCGRQDGKLRDPAWAEPICAVPADVIRAFARQYAAAKPAMLIPGYSIQRVRAGEESFRLTVALQVLTGNLGIKGGSSGSINNRLSKPWVGSLPKLERGDEIRIPVLRWPDAILEGKAGGYPADIRAAYFAGSNYVNQGADIGKNSRAMQALEFAVCHELFLTPTARLCDVVLPVAGPLEKADIGKPWLGNYLLYKPQVCPPPDRVRSDYAIFADLADRMGFGSAFHQERSEAAWLEHFLDESEIVDRSGFKTSGIYLGADQERVGLAAFAADPAGQPLSTPSGKVEILSRTYAESGGGPALPEWTPPETDPHHPLLLISPKTIYRTHSQNGGGLAWFGQAAGQSVEQPATRPPSNPVRPDFGELTVHPADAAKLDLSDGQTVEIYNSTGCVQARLRLTPDIMPGVVCLHEGVWTNLAGLKPDGSLSADFGSANRLSSTTGSGPAVAPVMHGIPVSLRTI